MSIALPEGLPQRRLLPDVAGDPTLQGQGWANQIGGLNQANLGAGNLYVGGFPAAPVQNPISGAAGPAKGFASLGKQALNLNPQLPQVQSNLVTDASYNAQQAQLAAEISQRYNDVLKQLGYTDPNTGQFVMGRIESDAARQRDELNRNIGLAQEAATQQRQLEGTLFSGRRGTEQARAEHPFVQSLADLDINVPQQLSDLYEQAGNVVSDYTLRNNLLLADLAQRRAAAAMAAPGPGGPPAPPPGPPPSGPPGVTPPVPTGDQVYQGTTSEQVSNALAGSGLDAASQANILKNWQDMMAAQAAAPGNAYDPLIVYSSGGQTLPPGQM